MKESQKKRYQIQRKRGKKRFFTTCEKKCLWERNRCDGRKVSEKGELSRKRTVTRDGLGLYLL